MSTPLQPPLTLSDSECKLTQECQFLENKVGCHGATDLALQCHGNDIPQAYNPYNRNYMYLTKARPWLLRLLLTPFSLDYVQGIWLWKALRYIHLVAIHSLPTHFE